jgi:hypothetical protein
MRYQRFLLALLTAVLVAGCGGKSSTPSAPSAPPVPNYAGNWTGAYTITGCTQTGGIALGNICGALGSSAPFRFALSQSSTSVTGSFALGSINFGSTGGTVDQGGSLALQATSVSNGVTIIVTWHLSVSSGTLTGTITQIWTSDTLSGQVNVAGTITSAIR